MKSVGLSAHSNHSPPLLSRSSHSAIVLQQLIKSLTLIDCNMERKNFLKNFAFAAVAGPMILDGCKKDSVTKSTTTTGTTSTTTSDSSSSCVVSPTETEGPYPYVGGELTNPLNRTDITTGQTGVPLTLTFIVVNAN